METKEVKRNCRCCGESHHFLVSKKGFDKWKSGSLIQDSMPELPLATRELLIFGTCTHCLDSMFVE